MHNIYTHQRFEIQVFIDHYIGCIYKFNWIGFGLDCQSIWIGSDSQKSNPCLQILN